MIPSRGFVAFADMEPRRNVTRTRMAISVHHARLAVCHDQPRLHLFSPTRICQMTSRLGSGARHDIRSMMESGVRIDRASGGCTWVDQGKQRRSNWRVGPGVGWSRINMLLFCLSGDGIVGDTDWSPCMQKLWAGKQKNK